MTDPAEPLMRAYELDRDARDEALTKELRRLKDIDGRAPAEPYDRNRRGSQQPGDWKSKRAE